MPTQRVVFSFFRYAPTHAFSAFTLMGFQSLFLNRDRPGGPIRLMGCGSGDGFSILPDFNQYCLMTPLAQPDDRAQLEESGFYRHVARPSITQLHFVLEAASGHGTWDGTAPFDYANQRVGRQPFAVLTRARVTPSRASAFWRSVPAIRQHLRDSPGCAYHIGFGEHPLLTLATFSVWQTLDSMQTFAYRHTPHHRVSQTARTEEWLTESLFVRFRIEAIEGDLERYPDLNRVWSDGRGLR